MPNNIVFVNSIPFSEVKSTLAEYVELYSDQFEVDYKFELYKLSDGNHVIVADERVDNERFFYLVNYLCITEDITIKRNAVGYTTIDKSMFKLKGLEGKTAMVFVPKEDQDGDNVYCVFDGGQSYKIDFGGKTKKEERHGKFELPEVDVSKLGKADTVKVNKKKAGTYKPITDGSMFSSDWRGRPWLRFVSYTLITLVLMGYAGSFASDSIANLIYSISPFIFPFLIASVDSKLLIRLNTYLAVLATSFILGIYSLSLGQTSMFAFGGVILLLVQPPYRKLYTWYMGREPHLFEKDEGDETDFIYSVLVLGTTIGILFLVEDWLNMLLIK